MKSGLIHVVLLSATTVWAASTHARGDDKLPSVEVKVGDPFRQCEPISAALPRTLADLRRQGRVLSQRISRNVEEFCDTSKYKCRLVDLKMDGLSASLLDVQSERVLSPLWIEITSSRWRLMKGVHVGQELSSVTGLYGVQAPPNNGKFQICGEVTCLEVGHRDGRVTSLGLDCQAGI